MNDALRKRPAALAALLLLATLPGCSLLYKQEPAATYQLSLPRSTYAAPSAQAQPQRPVLVIHTPVSSRVLDSDRVIIAQPDGRLAAWAGLRWADNAPVLLRDRLAEAFIHDARQAVRVDSSSFGSERNLVGTLQAFQFEQRSDASVVAIRLDLRLDDHGQPGKGASRRFEVERTATSKREADVIAAFSAASDALAEQVIGWVAQQPVTSIASPAGAAGVPRTAPAELVPR